MHVGYNIFGAQKYLFGDGTYSGNIIQLNHNNKAATTGATDNNTWIANTNNIPNGSIVRALSIYSTVAGNSQKLYILRDNGAYNYTTVVQLNITTDGTGWGYYALPTDYVVPATGRYVVGMHGSGTCWYTAAQTDAVYGASGGLAVGSSANFVAGTNMVVALGYWAITQPQASYTYTPVAQQTAGTGNAGGNGYTMLDRSWSLRQGETVSALKVYGAGAAFTPQLGIFRRNAAGNYTNVYKQLVSVPAAAGWHTFNLTTEYKVPVDAYTYHVGYYHINTSVYVGGMARSYVAGDIAAGATATFAEDVSNANMVGVVYKSIIFSDCIVITGAATVAPDAATGAAWFSCSNLAVVGAGASLTASTNCKGLIAVVSGEIILREGATVHMSRKGKAGNFGNLTVLDLVSPAYVKKLKKTLADYVVQGENPSGAAAGAMQTGSGNCGNGPYYWGRKLKGGPCCGGAGDHNVPGGEYGGPGGSGTGDGGHPTGGAAGDPVGVSLNGASPGTGPGGGLMMLLSPTVSIAPGCVVSADGADGGAGGFAGGGGAGGGCIVVITKPGSYANAGTVRANGGRSGYGGNQPGTVVWAFAGSVNIFTI